MLSAALHSSLGSVEGPGRQKPAQPVSPDLLCASPFFHLPVDRQAPRDQREPLGRHTGAWQGGWGWVAPVQECAPRSPASKCRHPQLAHSPWRAPPGGLSSCIPGTGWRSSRTGGAGPCGRWGNGEMGHPANLTAQWWLLFSEVPTVLASPTHRCHPGVRQSQWAPLAGLLPP